MRRVTLIHNFLPLLTTFLHQISTLRFLFLLHWDQKVNLVCFSWNKKAQLASQLFWVMRAQFKGSSTPRAQSCQSTYHSAGFLHAGTQSFPQEASCRMLEQNEHKMRSAARPSPPQLRTQDKSIQYARHVIHTRSGSAGWREAKLLRSQQVQGDPAGWDDLLAS